jgi:hypothetical protein
MVVVVVVMVLVAVIRWVEDQHTLYIMLNLAPIIIDIQRFGRETLWLRNSLYTCKYQNWKKYLTFLGSGICISQMFLKSV